MIYLIVRHAGISDGVAKVWTGMKHIKLLLGYFHDGVWLYIVTGHPPKFPLRFKMAVVKGCNVMGDMACHVRIQCDRHQGEMNEPTKDKQSMRNPETPRLVIHHKSV